MNGEKFLKKKAEEMNKRELVDEFRKLQKWYNAMKIAVDDLEKKYAELQGKYDKALEANLLQFNQLRQLNQLLQVQITQSNNDKQMLQNRISQYQTLIQNMKVE